MFILFLLFFKKVALLEPVSMKQSFTVIATFSHRPCHKRLNTIALLSFYGEKASMDFW